MAEKLNSLALGYSAAIIAGACMLLLSLAGYFGMYPGAVEMMTNAHMFYSLSILGTITGIIEAAVMAFVTGHVFGRLYNRLA
ncbi:hypothetical protein COV19_00315 [Candidatus Woesearchaeota archaeon CG10_big_fil_rev_8_21_14_0_10_44_13]|nr:MAG: hypothetical protein COV19_00315 [Candidatus Woesearchaeota archaeon CG10_big_fil_rev_8_21_14_0_10_44_13]